MFELSPLLTAANAYGVLDARLEQGVPVEADARHPPPLERGAEPAERVGVLVDDGDGVAAVLEAWARVEPTRPQPMITKCTTRPGRYRRSVSCDAADPAAHGRSGPCVSCHRAVVRTLLKRLLVGRRPLAQRPAGRDAAAQTDRAAGVRLGRAVVGGVRAGRDLPHPVGRRAGGLHASPWIGLAVASSCSSVVASYRQNVHAYPSGGGDYEVATDQPRAKRRAHGGERAAGRLRAHRRRVDLLGRAVRRRRDPRPRGATRRLSPSSPCVAPDGDEPARRPGVRDLVRGPDVRLHGRDHRDGACRGFVRLLAREPAAGRERRGSTSRPQPAVRARPRRRWPARSCCCGPSPPGAPRSPASRRSATASRPSRSPRARTRPPRWRCSGHRRDDAHGVIVLANRTAACGTSPRTSC